MTNLSDLLSVSPQWFHMALAEVGTREEINNTGPAVQRYIDMAHCGAQGEPWCAIFANAMLESAGVTGTRSPSSQSFANSSLFYRLSGAVPGAIAVFWRGSQQSGLGHVGFYRGETPSYVYTLGGNEADMVQIEALPKASASFGLRGFYWPYNVPLLVDAPAPIVMPAGLPPVTAPQVV